MPAGEPARPDATEPGKTRVLILDILAAKRGVHKSELCRLAQRGWGTIGHHVYMLVRAGRAETEVHGRHLWVFLPDVSRADRDWIAATHVQGRVKLLEVLGVRKKLTIDALSTELAVSKKVIRTHLGHLRRIGAVARVQGSPGTASAYEAAADRR